MSDNIYYILNRGSIHVNGRNYVEGEAADFSGVPDVNIREFLKHGKIESKADRDARVAREESGEGDVPALKTKEGPDGPKIKRPRGNLLSQLQTMAKDRGSAEAPKDAETDFPFDPDEGKDEAKTDEQESEETVKVEAEDYPEDD